MLRHRAIQKISGLKKKKLFRFSGILSVKKGAVFFGRQIFCGKPTKIILVSSSASLHVLFRLAVSSIARLNAKPGSALASRFSVKKPQ